MLAAGFYKQLHAHPVERLQLFTRRASIAAEAGHLGTNVRAVAVPKWCHHMACFYTVQQGNDDTGALGTDAIARNYAAFEPEPTFCFHRKEF